MTFKRFNASESSNYDGVAHEPGTLTWDSDNGLRIHDGYTDGGSSVGAGFSGNFYDLYNRPNGDTAVHDLIGGAASADNGNYLQQTSIGVSQWTALPTTYDTLTIDTKIIGGIDGVAGTKITGIEATLGSGSPYRYVFLSSNDAFGNLFNRGSSIIGWKIYPANDPSQFVTITEFLNNDLGGPSLGFSGGLAQGPWIAESSDYSAGTPGPLTLSADTKDWVFGTNGKLTLPAGGDIVDSTGTSVLGGAGGSSFSGSYNDLTDKPNVPADVSDLTDNTNLLGNPFDQSLNTTDSPAFSEVYLSQTGVIHFPTTEGLEWDSAVRQETREAGGRFGLVVDGERDVTVTSQQGQFQWLFDNDGTLHLPSSVGDIKRDGTSVLGGGGSSSPAGAGSTSYSDVWVYSDKADSFWTQYSLTGNIAGIFGSAALTGLNSQVAYGKQMSAGDKVLNINDHAIHTNSTYGVVFEFPSSPTLGDTFSTPLITSSTTVTAGSFVVGTTYTIVDPGTTNFMLIGAGGNYPGLSFVATGIGSGTGTASVSNGVGKAIYKPATGQKAIGMSNGQGERPVFGQGTNYIAAYIDVSSQMGGNPVVWVYAGVISSVPTWYQFYF